MTITTSGNEITMSGHYVRNPLGTLTPFGSSKPTKCFVEYKGIICGRGIAYTKITKDLENTRRSLLSIEDNHWKENGIMIISEDCNSIRVFKDAKDDELKSYQITRMNH